MNPLEYKRAYRRKLPHHQPPGATFFITTRLAGSLPNETWRQLRKQFDDIYREVSNESTITDRERTWFEEYDHHLDSYQAGPHWLRDERIANVLAETLHFFNHKRYELYSYSIMSNHLHLVFMPLPKTDPALKAFASASLVENDEGDLGYLNTERNFIRLHFYSLASIMHSIKRHSALECNKLLDRSGPFWEVENYDRFARNSREVERMIRYTLNNPVKAGLVEKWDQWKWNWRKDPIKN